MAEQSLDHILLVCKDAGFRPRFEKQLAGLYKAIGRRIPVDYISSPDSPFSSPDSLVERVELLLPKQTDGAAVVPTARVVVVAPLNFEGDADGVERWYDPMKDYDIHMVLVGEPKGETEQSLKVLFDDANKERTKPRLMHVLKYDEVGRKLLDAGIFPKSTAKKSKRGLYVGMATLVGVGALVATAWIASDVGHDQASDELVPQVNSLRSKNSQLSDDKADLYRLVSEQKTSIDGLTKRAGEYRTQVRSLTGGNATLQETVRTQQAGIASRDQRLSEDATRISELAASGEQCNTNLTTCQGELQTAQAAATQATASGSAAPQQHCRYPGTFRCNYQRAEYRHSSDVILPGGNRQPSSTGHRHR
jgi:outer membrane murein-binding lipoprotein Lpp